MSNTQTSANVTPLMTCSQLEKLIEKTNNFNGLYHILHGAINPIEGVTPDHIKVRELFDRIKNDDVQEVILALDATSDGEATTLYLNQNLKSKIKIRE